MNNAFPKSYPTPARQIFTLIELLVAIAIIMVLVAILLPGLSKAKETAKTSVCLSNIKQTYLGVSVYASDFNGYAPFYRPWLGNTAAMACTSILPVVLASGSGWGASRAGQMVDPQYWPAGILKCPERKDWEEFGVGAWRCFDAAGYYRKKPVYYAGANQILCTSYALKPCSRANWSLGAAAIGSATLNLSYRLGQNPCETLLMDFFSCHRAPNPRHKFPVAYEDGAARAVLLKSWTQVTTMSGSADAFMDIIRKMGRDYSGPRSW